MFSRAATIYALIIAGTCQLSISVDAATYDGSSLPSAAAPSWIYDGTSELADFSSNGGVLTLAQSEGSISQYYRQAVGIVPAGDGIAGTPDFYLETRFKLDANATQANNVYDLVLGLLQNKSGTLYTDDALYVKAGPNSSLNIVYRRQAGDVVSVATNDGIFHTLRMEYDNNAATTSGVAGRVLVDGAIVAPFGNSPVVNFGTSFGDRIIIGNNGGGGPITGFHWDYVTSGAMGQNRPIDFGHQWVKSHPFTLGGWCVGIDPSQSKFQLFQGAGLNLEAGNDVFNTTVPVHLWPGYLDSSDYMAEGVAVAQKAHPNRTGWVVYDEPSYQQMAGLGRAVAYLKNVDADKLSYVNVFPNVAGSSALWGGGGNPGYTYTQYLDDIMTIVRPDVLCYDAFPFSGDGSGFYTSFIPNMMQVRAKAQQYNVPYFGHVQSFELFDTYLPTPTELRVHMYSQLTAGYQGILYYAFESHQLPQALLVTSTGQPSSLYDTAATVNAEVQRLGVSLSRLRNADVRFIPGIGRSFALEMQNWSAGAGSDFHILSLSSVNDAHGLIGFFHDDNNEQYFMLTNMKHGRGLTVAGASGAFNILFDSSTNAIYRLNRLTGAPERIALSNHILQLTLPGGTGDLFKYDNGYFTGIVAGDADLDGDVDLSDLGTLASSYGITNGGLWLTGDFDLDGDIDLADLSTLAANYGAGSIQAIADFQSLLAVPEPSALAFLLFGCLISLRHRMLC